MLTLSSLREEGVVTGIGADGSEYSEDGLEIEDIRSEGQVGTCVEVVDNEGEELEDLNSSCLRICSLISSQGKGNGLADTDG